MKVAIYARMSTKDRQDVLNQLKQLREFCKSKDWKIYREYIDKDSGAKSNRSEFKKLFEDARQKKFEAVVFWALDRFTREGVLPTLKYLEELNSYDVGFYSFTEKYLDSLGMFKDAVIGILSTLAKQERQRISERVKAGLERTKAKGTKLGRPKTAQTKRDKVIELRKKGNSYRDISKKLDIGIASISRILNK